MSVVGIRASARLEEVSGERGRYAGSVVYDVDVYAVGTGVRADGDGRVGVAAGVGEERADDAFEEGGWDSGGQV